MEIATAIISPVVESLMQPIKKHLGYLVSSTKYVKLMSKKMGDLDEKRCLVKNHVESNEASNLQIPTDVSTWLKNVGNIKAEVESVCSDVNNCFNLKMRYKIGKKVFNTIQMIDSLINEYPGTRWTGDKKILGKVDSKKSYTLAPSIDYTGFKSRELMFKKALEALRSDHKTHMIALCGMAGVGKTTMMQKLEEVVKEKKMFDFIVKAAIREKTDPIVVQQDMADYLSAPLVEVTKEARADRLRETFKARSKGGEKKILVILDDVWESVDLNDIGLSPLPNQGVGFKFLLTSRNENVCIKMKVESTSIFKVEVLKELEAQRFFRQCLEPSVYDDSELQQIGEDIVRRCGGLPIAIIIIASNLRDQIKDVWRDTQSRLQHNNFSDILDEIFKMSYEKLNEKAKAIFLLCGLFHEDSDIVTEDLMRYGWGLKLFNKVFHLREARSRLNKCVSELIRANLLIQSDYAGCVKMHDLLRDYVLRISEHESIVNHGNMSSGQQKIKAIESYKRVSLTCMGMSAFPGEFNCPNLLLLKLMKGDESLKFPQDFYGRMEKLLVIDYESIRYPMLPGSLQCSTNLRTLRLHSCSLMNDLSQLGNLMNLEILSFAGCGIRKLPSTIGNLKSLKLIDLTGCIDLQIDDGVLGNLCRLEELYMRVYYERGIRFTDNNCDEWEKLSENLYALEVEFFDSKAYPNNLSFSKLERFKISMGMYLEEGGANFEKTLSFITNKDELLKSGINELFSKTEVLDLSVDDMNDLEDVLEPLRTPRPSSFQNLRVLNVSECEKLTYLFSFPVAQGLCQLEHLEVFSCPNMQEIVHVDDHHASEKIRFQKLDFLSLYGLPKLESSCRNVDIIELRELVELRLDGLPNFTSIYPENKSSTTSMCGNVSTMQPFLKEEVVIPKLEKLNIKRMEKLKQIWPCQFSGRREVDVCILKHIRVEGCYDLTNLFPRNPMPFLHHLEDLLVWSCGSIESIFNIDLGCVCEIEESSSNLRRINVYDLGRLKEVWRVKDVNNSHHITHGFGAVEDIWIRECKRFRNVFTSTTANFDLEALKKLRIDCREPLRYGIKKELVGSSTNTRGQQVCHFHTLNCMLKIYINALHFLNLKTTFNVI